MDNDDKMGSKAYAWFDHTFMLFGSLCKSFAPGIPVEDWQGWADQWLNWAKTNAKELVDEAYNGKEERAAKPSPPDEEPIKYANDAQARRIYAVAMKAGFTKEAFKQFLERHGCKDAWHIPISKYNSLCELARDKTVATQFSGKEF
jgi:hypothetical protein